MILGLLLLTAGVARAEPGETLVMGSGQYSCGQFIAAIGDAPPGRFRGMNTAKGVIVSENARYQEWLAGFVSGFNASHNGDQLTKIDPAGMDLWMRNWCNKHPTEMVFDGAVTFINEMQAKAAADQAAPGSGDGYSKPARDSLKKLIEKPAAR
jgi:hypothetical protein